MASCSLSIPYCIDNVEKCFGCMICRTKLSGGVSFLRESTLPKLQAVILFRRAENQSEHCL